MRITRLALVATLVLVLLGVCLGASLNNEAMAGGTREFMDLQDHLGEEAPDNNDVVVKESVKERHDDNEKEDQEREWDTDGDGGTTMVLQNKNSLEAHSRKDDLKKLAEFKAKRTAEHQFKRKEEDRYKNESEADQKKDEQYAKSKAMAREGLIKRKQETRAKKYAKKAEAFKKKRAEEEAKGKWAITTDTTPWKDYGGSWEVGKAYKQNQICYIQGLLRGAANTGLIGLVPKACMPGVGRLIFTAIAGYSQVRVDVLRDGRLYLITRYGTQRHNWLSLSNIAYPVGATEKLPIGWAWKNYGHSYAPALIRREGDICTITGLIRGGEWKFFAKVPSWCKPKKQLIFSQNNHQYTTRVDVTPNGYLKYAGGQRSHGWVSISMAFSRNEGKALKLHTNWSNYGTAWRSASYTLVKNVCMVSGLVTYSKSNKFSTYVGTLPEECRPKKHIIFHCNMHTEIGRCDVLADGRIYVRKQPRHKWVSLTGMNFVVDLNK